MAFKPSYSPTAPSERACQNWRRLSAWKPFEFPFPKEQSPHLARAGLHLEIFDQDSLCLMINIDGFVKSPSAALRCIIRRCGVPLSTPHSSGFARLTYGAFYFAIPILTFYEIIIFV
ncbi:MAG: hypothetical protein FJ117_15580 [Deltaproteobacteria bacterium]|nr:hypothetical protein [Deltaproteobacteria bacterium]